MPLYEYRCGECGARYEALVAAGAAAPACPKCGAEVAERLLSAPAPKHDIVTTPREMRKQERRNAELHARAKADFKERSRRARKAGAGGGDG